MKKLRIGLIIFLILLVAGFGYLLFVTESKKNIINQDCLEKDIALVYWNSSFEHTYKNTNLHLNDVKVFLGNDTSKIYNISSLVNGKTLIFKFSGNMCDVCIDKTIKNLKDNFPDYASNKNIILLGTELNPQVRETFFGKRVISYYNNQKLGMSLENFDAPFFFMIDKTLISNMVFLPNVSDQELTDKYLKVIKGVLN